jgi:CRP/FNR family transcriptional regulator, anaerobic regulatory protein
MEFTVNARYAASSAVQPAQRGVTTPSCPIRGNPHWSTLQQVCELLNISVLQLPGHSDVMFRHVTFNTGQYLHRTGQRFDHLCVVNSGFLKTLLLDDSGTEHVLGFPMRGDLLGVDGIQSGHHASGAVALSNCDIVMVPFKLFCRLGRTYPELELGMYSAMSQELIREQALASAIASLGAEARIARFLAALSERYSSMGYSGKLFSLRMTRREIGSYLGLTLETVSRTITALSVLGLIVVKQRNICILDLPALKTLVRLPPKFSRSRHSRMGAEKIVFEEAGI